MTVEPAYATQDVHGNPVEGEELDDVDLEVEPFVKSNWKTKSSRDEWSDRLSAMAEAKGVAEWRSVLSDKTDRKAAIIHVNNLNREEWLKRVGEYGLSYRNIRYSAPYNGFSHKHLPVSETDPERVTYAVIAENDDIADKMEEAELEFDTHEKHETVGKLLGFPDCCRKFFNDVWIDEGWRDPMYEITYRSGNAKPIDGDRERLLVEDPEPWNNVLYRYFGASFITHLPCSWDCEHSHDIAQARGEIMAENGYRDAANDLWEWLSLPMVWTGLHRLCHIRNRHFVGSSHTSLYWSEKEIVWGERHEAGGSIL